MDAKAVESPAYMLGLLTGRGLAHLALSDSEWQRFETALRDYRRDGPPRDLAELLPTVEPLQRARAEAALQRERAAERAWLAEAAAAGGAITLASGAVLRILERGEGRLPTPTDTVRLDVRGSLQSRVIFDSAAARGDSTAHTLDKMLPCWAEALLQTPVGSTIELICPSAAAYGDRGLPPLVPPGAALRYEIRLLEVRMDPASIHRNLR